MCVCVGGGGGGLPKFNDFEGEGGMEWAGTLYLTNTTQLQPG